MIKRQAELKLKLKFIHHVLARGGAVRHVAFLEAGAWLVVTRHNNQRVIVS